MKVKMTLAELLASPDEKKILFLGREGIFTQQEIVHFLKKFNVQMTSKYEDDITAVIEHSMLNPVEEDISNTAYENGVTLYKLKELEKILSESINDDELLMGIKLANDQGRIYRLLENAYLSDALFVKLLGMYEWHDEEEDNTEDRNVIMYTLRRYIAVKPNEEDLLYSYLTLRRLAAEAADPKLLSVLIRFPNYGFLVKGKRKITLRETIALNPNIDQALIHTLLSFRNMKINAALCANSVTPLEILHRFIDTDEKQISLALAGNKNIDRKLFDILLTRDEDVVQELLWKQDIDADRLKEIESMRFPDALFAVLGANRYLSDEVKRQLLQSTNSQLLAYLSANDELSAKALETLYARDVEACNVYLATNPSLAVSLLEALYDKHQNDKAILISLSLNPSTPERILRELFEKDDFEINKGLASNASVPLELLNILKIDTRLRNELTVNETFVASITQKLGL